MAPPRFLFAAALAALPFTAHCQDTGAARSLAATCAACHGTDGRSVTKEVVGLAGLPKEHIVAQMKAFKEGGRPATLMHQLAKGYTEQQIDLIAGYFAAQKR
jgi:cytochrome subunit of sulfide dehydrogenase